MIEGDDTLTLYPRAGTNIFYVGMNNAFAPFDNEKVRQAFAMAIDRNRIVDNFYPAGSIVATQFMPPSIFGYSEGQDWYEYDPEMAKQILTEEGVYDANSILKTRIFLSRHCPRLPARARHSSPGHPGPAQGNRRRS